MVVRKLICGSIFLLALIVAPAGASAQAGAVAIVVHPTVKIDNLSFADLKKIFRGEQQFWGNDGKSRITLLMRAPVAAERKLVLDRIYGLSEDQFRQFWIAKMFRTESATGPKIVYSSEMARDLVSAIPGAITFLPADAVPPGMKVLRIDGELPTGAKYPLRGK
jgi:hypothetical protein